MSSATSSLESKPAIIEAHQNLFTTRAPQVIDKILTKDLVAYFQTNAKPLMSAPLQFKATHIDPLQEPINSTDERTKTFFDKMMAAVDKTIASVPSALGVVSMLNKITRNESPGNLLVQGIAYPNIVAFMAELDQEEPKIVEEVEKPL
jgi:hypothetical protein